MIRKIAPAILSAGILLFIAGCEVPDEHIQIIKGEGETLFGKHVALLVGEGFHDGETLIPMGYLTSRGARVTVIGAEKGKVKAYNSDFTVYVEQSVDNVTPANFDAVIIPGGTSPAWLREHENVIEFAREYFENDGLTAAICHGPQVLITAGVLGGRTLTAVGGVSGEIEDAGGHYVDESVVRDQNLITSRVPGDLYNFCTAIEKALLESAGGT